MSPAAGRVCLIVNGDDFGLSDAVNEGVARAHLEGVVTSTTIMVGGPAFADALARLDDLPALGVGIHLTLCGGPAVLNAAAAPTLINDAGLLPADAAAFVRRYFLGAIKTADVRAELEAQWARARDAGLRLTHFDSHQHLHNLPGVAALTLDLASRCGVRAARLSACGLWPPARGWLGRQWALRFYAESFGARARRAGFKLPAGLVGQEIAGALTPERIINKISSLPPGTRELLCHPGTAREPGDPPPFHRPGDLAAVTAPEVRAALEERAVRLVNFAAL